MKLISVFFFLLANLTLSTASFATDEGDQVIEQFERAIDQRLEKERIEKIREKNRNRFEKALNRTHKKISSSIFTVSDGIDEFFAGEKFQEEKNGSLIRFGYETLMVDSRDPRHNIRLNTRLVLPRTQDRLNFLLQSLDDETTNDEQLPASNQNFTTLEEEKKQSLFAGLRFKNIQTKEWSVNTDAGVKLVWTPDPFGRLRLRRSFFMSNWELRLTENVYWYESEGWSQLASLDLQRPIPEKNLLKFGNLGTRTDDDGFWRFSHSVGWFHRSSPSQGLSYATGITSVEEPSYSLSSYFASIALRQMVFEDWIFLDVVPTASWPREENFVFVPSLKIKLEAVFGGI